MPRRVHPRRCDVAPRWQPARDQRQSSPSTIQSIRLQLAENAKLPLLDCRSDRFSAGKHRNGHDGMVADGFVDLRRGLKFEQPIGNREAEAQLPSQALEQSQPSSPTGTRCRGSCGVEESLMRRAGCTRRVVGRRTRRTPKTVRGCGIRHHDVSRRRTHPRPYTPDRLLNSTASQVLRSGQIRFQELRAAL